VIKDKVIGPAERSGQWKTNWARGTETYKGQSNFGNRSAHKLTLPSGKSVTLVYGHCTTVPWGRCTYMVCGERGCV